MFYEGYVCKYLVDERGLFSLIDEPEYCGGFADYSAATEWFTEVMKNHEGLARWFVKVYADDEAEGEILCACSMEWGDNLFNERAV